MAMNYDQVPAGGNSSIGNPNRPKDIEGDETIDTASVDGLQPPKPAAKGSKPAERSASIHGSVGSGDIHKPS